MVHVLYTKSYDRLLKKLSKYSKEKQVLLDILEFIRNSKNIQSLKSNGLAKMYGFEQFKHNLHRFHSFNLCKNVVLFILI